MPDNSIGTVVTSPPYNLRDSTGNGLRSAGPGGNWKHPGLAGEGYPEFADDMPRHEYVEWQRSCMSEMMRLLMPDGSIWYNHKWRVQDGRQQDQSDIVNGFPLRQTIIRQYAGSHNHNPGYFMPNYEVVYLICGPDFRLAPGTNTLGCVWYIPQERNKWHPAPMPLELALRCVESSGKGPVLDPFAGSGTTALAALDCGLDWICVEQSSEFADKAETRIAAYGARQRMFSDSEMAQGALSAEV